MYLINKVENKISKLKENTFSDLGFKEREHLQEWLAGNPGALGEELLIIQKEFAGFNDTKERLDLLALDKQGNLVIIENKLDDSGRDATWQVLKYASYCSSLTKENIKNIYQEYLSNSCSSDLAEDKLSEFLDGKDLEEITLNQGTTQRIMMVSGSFRKEVTSTVLWLMNFNIRIQCFKLTPFSFGDQLLLNVEQILPVKDTEEFAISMATKVREEINTLDTLKERHSIRFDFWKAYLLESNQKNSLFSNISPSKDNWINFGIGMSGLSINLVVTKTHCRAEVYFNRGNQVDNKEAFDYFYKRKDAIENVFGDQLVWERMDEKVSSRIKYQLDGVNVFEKEDWPKMIAFLIDASVRMEKAVKGHVKKLNALVKGKKK
jgi:hypothetical protein